jgi:hypothetical protein
MINDDAVVGLRRISEMEFFRHVFPRMRYDFSSLPNYACVKIKSDNESTHLFLVLLPDLELLLVWETNTVHTLQRVIVGITQPVGSRVFGGRKSFDLPSVGNVWTTAQINQVSTFVDSGTSSISNLGCQNLLLERVVSKQLQGFFLGDDHTFEFLLGLGNLGNFLLDRLV